MDKEGVKYRISLEDLFSGGIKTAHSNAHTFEKAVGQITEKMRGLRGMIFEAFAGYEILRFGKESVHAFEEMERSKSQLDNALRNRDVGFTTKELTEQAEAYSKKWIFSKDQIIAAQVELTKFKNLHGDMFTKTQELAINIASRTGGDIKESMNSVGRALNDPEHAARLLRPMGVAFTSAQEKMIRQLVETGRVAKAQDIIFRTLNDTFKGSADAAAHTAEGMKAITGHSWNEFQESVGSTIDKIEMALLPTLDSIIPFLQKFADWVGDHSEYISGFFIGIKDAVKVLFGMDIHGSKLEESFSWLEGTLSVIHTAWTKLVYLGVYMREGFKLGMDASLGDVKIAADAKWDEMFGKGAEASRRMNNALKGLAEKESPAGGKKLTKTSSDIGDFGAGVSEPKASKIQNITITMQHVMEGWKVSYGSTGEGVADFKTKLLEALNSVVQDTAIIATE